MDLNALALPDLYRHLTSTGLVRRLLELARDEDLGAAGSAGGGDITSIASVPSDGRANLLVSARGACVVAGLAAMGELLGVFAPSTRVECLVQDGSGVARGTTLARVTGPAREALALERPMLNLLSRLSGIATRTAAHVSAIPSGTRARLFDTRKTTPGLRVLEKYAVRCGGGCCHRLGLFDAVLIKDNHLAGVGLDGVAEFVAAAARRARAMRPGLWFVQVEVDSLEQFERVLAVAPGLIDLVLLDNMGPGRLAEAVAMRNRLAPAVGLEASGNVSLETIGDIARAGVDRISSGSITHHAVWVDIGLDAA